MDEKPTHTVDISCLSSQERRKLILGWLDAAVRETIKSMDLPSRIEYTNHLIDEIPKTGC